MIGRTKEVAELENLYLSQNAELVAIYGRRRVGKTYLIDETFKDRITFRHAGLSPIEEESSGRPITKQLQAFYYSLLQYGMRKSHVPKDWLEAFFMLEELLTGIESNEKQIIFLDELPWMDTPKSGFITAFESFWNGWACHRKNILVIVCGSANSWILDRLINDHGGLYGRVTYEIKLEPFTLKECEECFASRNIVLSRYDIAQSYMILGGIPYYLNYFQRGKSLAQNIDNLFFSKPAKLRYEFDRLFAAVFNNPEYMKKIITFLSKKSIGFSRNEIITGLSISNGSVLTNALNALIISDFIVKYTPFSHSKREQYYKLVDPFCLFYLRFVAGNQKINNQFWQNNVTSHAISSWRGFAFENLCFSHINQIKQSLGILSVETNQSAYWSNNDDANNSQIDMIIERNDNIVNMCEIKFYGNNFEVDKNYDLKLRNRQAFISNHIPKKAIIHNTLITTFGLTNNKYSDIFNNVVLLDDLFSN